MKYKKAMKDFENLTQEEQTNVIMQIGAKLTGQEIWYWEGIVHKLRTLQEENKKLETTLNTWAEVAKDEEKRKYEFMERNRKAYKIIDEALTEQMITGNATVNLIELCAILKGGGKE